MHARARPRPSGRAVLAAATAVVTVVATAALAGCGKGYPQADIASISPFEMTQAQRLAAMNTVGRRAHPELRWTYQLLPGCVLRVDLDGPAGPQSPWQVALPGALVGLSTAGEGSYHVDVRTHATRSARDPHTPGRPVLQSEGWSDASWMQLLLRVVQKGCLDATPAP